MLFLFNSAFYPRYQRNVLNFLGLPKNHLVTLRYTIGKNVFKDEIIYFSRLYGEPVTIIYVDRFHENKYRYIPIRTGKLFETEEDGDKYFFRVLLEDYLFAENITDYSKTLVEELKGNLPTLTNNDPSTTEDGPYARLLQNRKSVPSLNKITKTGVKHWANITDQINNTKAFSDYKTLFIRFSDVGQQFDRQSIITRRKRKLFKIIYRNPRYNNSTNDKLMLNIGGSARVFPQSAYIDAEYSEVEFTVMFDSTLDSNLVQLSIVSVSSENDYLMMNDSIKIKKYFNFTTILIILGVAALVGLAGLLNRFDGYAWIILAGFIQTIVTVIGIIALNTRI